MIPKIIHQTAPENKEKWDPIWEECQLSWKNVFPNFEYVFWNDDDIENLVKNDYSQFYAEYKSCEYNIIKIDFGRLCILHKYGGIYADMDFYCYKNFYNFLKEKEIYLVESWQSWGEKVQNSLMASVPQHNFWMKCCQLISNNLKNNSNLTSYKDLLNFCGPGILSKLLNEQIGILPRQLFNPKINNQFNWAYGNYESTPYRRALLEFFYLNNNETEIFTRHYLTGVWCDKNDTIKK